MVAPVGPLHRRPGGGEEGVAVGALGQEQQARVGAELAGAEGQRPDVRLGERLDVAVGQCAGKHDDRVDRRHLGVDRDRLGTVGGGCDEREPAAAGAGEADGLDPRVADQLLAELDAALPVPGEHEREHPGRQAGLLDRAGDRAGDELAGARVGGVALDDDRAAGGQRGGGVAAGGGEGEREVAGAEDRHRTERDHPLPQVGPRQRRPVGQRRVEPYAEVVAAAYDAGEEPQLAGGAADLAGDPALGQGALGHGGLDDRVAVGLDLVGDGVEERAALLGGGGAVGRERVGGRGRGGLDGGGLGVGAGNDRVGGERHGRSPPGNQLMRLIRSPSSATSASVRSVSGARTGPAGRPMAVRPALTIETA